MTNKQETLTEKIDAVLGKWVIWVSILLLFLPGVLYQINILGADASAYNGLSVIIFLAVSFYFSIPFSMIGMVVHLVGEDKSDVKKNPLLGMGLYSVAIYFMTDLISTLSGVFFWHMFLGISVGFIGIAAIDGYIKNKKGKNK